MLQPTILNNVGETTVWTITVTNGPTSNTGVFANLTVPAEFTIINSFPTVGALVGNVWTIGDMTVGQSVKIGVLVELTGTPASFDETYSLTAVVSGLDTLVPNNTLTDTLSYKVDSCTPLASASPITGCAGCVDASADSTECSEGTTEYRLNPGTVNSTVNTWDISTGKGTFEFTDITQDITGTYNLVCVSGGTDYVIVSNVPFTIPKLTSSLNVVLDGNTTSFQRVDAIQDVEPTALEVPSPIDGDSAEIFLSDNTLEVWSFTTVWTKKFSIDHAVGVGALTATDTNTIDFTVAGSDVTGSVIPSPTGDNGYGLSDQTDGLAVVTKTIPVYGSHALATADALLLTDQSYTLIVGNPDGVTSTGKGPIFRK